MLSQVSKDTIRLVIHLADEQSKGFVRIREVSDEIGISYHKLSKVAQNLARAGVLDSHSGPNGGFRLKRRPQEIFLLDVIEAVDLTHSIDNCVIGFTECDENNPCPLHNNWKVAKAEIRKVFSERTLSEFISLAE